MTVSENVGYSLKKRRVPKDQMAQRVEYALSQVNMTEYANHLPSQLSGGQQQRTFIARALAQQADIYLMDEPFKGVDNATEISIIELLKDLRREGKTVVAVHHDLSTVSDYFDWVTLINIKVVASGEVGSVFTDENLTRTYRTAKAGSLI